MIFFTLSQKNKSGHTCLTKGGFAAYRPVYQVFENNTETM